MALTYDNLTAITKKFTIPKLVDNIYSSNPLLLRMKDRGIKYRGGEQIKFPIVYAKGRGGSYSGFDTFDVRPKDQLTAGILDWKFYEEPIVYSGEEMIKNSGKEGILDLIDAKRQIAEINILDNLGTGLFSDGTGNNSKDMTGFKAFLSTSTTYGGIAVADFSNWVAQMDTTTNTLTLAALQKQYGSQTIGNDKPTLIISNQACYDKFWSLLLPHQRFNDTKLASAGFDSILFNSVPWIVDSHSSGSGYGTADNYIIFVNEKYLHLYIQQERDFKLEPFQKPVNQDVYVGHILYTGNVVCTNRRMQGAFTVVNPSL